MTTLAPAVLDVARDPGRLPDPVADRPRRPPPGLPGLGGDRAAAAAGAGRRAGVPGAAQRGRAPRRAPARRGGHRRVRVGARPDRGVRRGGPERGGVHQERHRGDQPRRLRVLERVDPHRPGPRVGAVRARARRRDRRHRAGAPREPRALAGAVPAHRRGPALVPRDRRRAARPRLARAVAAHEDRGVRAPVQRARHGPAGRGAGVAGPRGRGADRARRLPVGAAPAGEPHRAGCRLRRLLGPQDARPVRGGRAVGPGRAARGDAAVPHRRFHDRAGADGGVDLRPAAAAVRGGRADDVAGRRPRGGRRLPHRHRDGRRGGARAGADGRGARRAALRARRAARRSGEPGVPRRGGVVRRRRRARPRRRAGARRPRGGRAGGAPLRVAAASPVRGGRHGPRHLRACTTRRRRWPRWWTACTRPASSSG